jgi:hypothetical protein
MDWPEDQEKSMFRVKKTYKEVWRSVEVVKSRVNLLRENELKMRSAARLQAERIRALVARKLQGLRADEARSRGAAAAEAAAEERRRRNLVVRMGGRLAVSSALRQTLQQKQARAAGVKAEAAQHGRTIGRRRAQEQRRKEARRAGLQATERAQVEERLSFLLRAIEALRGQKEAELRGHDERRERLEDALKELELEEMGLIHSLTSGKGQRHEHELVYRSLMHMPRQQLYHLLHSDPPFP